MEISRWRQPPDPTTNDQSPRQGRQHGELSGAPSGARSFFPGFRWLAPPANFRSPSGRGKAATNFARLNNFPMSLRNTGRRR